MQKLKFGILIVNGLHDYKDYLWLEVSLSNIIRYISNIYPYKIFVWNHNIDSQYVSKYLDSLGDTVEILNENRFDMSLYDPEKKYRMSIGPTFAGGFHIHSTPLQILYEYAISKYDIDIIFTFDSDACPVRGFWDVPLVFALDNGKKITGIWRNELIQVIEPYVHPSCLGIKVETIKELNLQFNQCQVYGKIDTLAHFTYIIRDNIGEEYIYPLTRNNQLQYHQVFNGIYGGLIYHHHFGTRNKQGKAPYLRSYGWKERMENMPANRMIMDGTTEMIFTNTTDFLDSLTYGESYLKYKVYRHYFNAYPSKFRAYKLFHHARIKYESDPHECFFILSVIIQYLAKEQEFISLYIAVCETLGLDYEAKAYRTYSNQ